MASENHLPSVFGARLPHMLTDAWSDLALVMAAYFFVLGGLLLHTDFLPYVFDNNESFSAYIHGSNLYHFGLSKSFGLTDEAYGLEAAAHPYVYTHQGNFPRLYTYLMYVLGLRTVEAQILVSTFTVGASSIALAWLFFRRLAGRATALAAGLLFISEYVLMTQWLFNTFKAWHGLLLFAMLVLIQKWEYERRSVALFQLAAVSVCVGYFDLLMGVFTFVLCSAFAIISLARLGRRATFHALGAMLAGGLAGVAIHVAQLLGYYGWEGLKQDFYITFISRNYSATHAVSAERWQDFFLQHNIVFWETLIDSKPILSLGYAMKSIFQYGLAVLTPYFSFLMAALLLPQVVGRIFDWMRARRFVLRTPEPGFGPGMRFLFFFSANVLTAVVCLTDSIEGRPEATSALPNIFGSTLIPLALLAVAMGLLFTQLAGRKWPTATDSRPVSLLPATISLLLLTCLALAQHLAYWVPGDPIVSVWGYVIDPWMRSGSTKMFAIIAVIVGVWDLLRRSAKRDVASSSAQGRDQPRRIWQFILAAMAGYFAAYFFSPGYMVAVNLKNYTPLLVFIAIPAVAGGFAVAWKQMAEARTGSSPVARALALLLVVHLAIFWVGRQWSYFSLLPPDGAAPFLLLDKPPYKGSGFVVSGYAAPVAVKTSSWAFIDNRFIATGAYSLDKNGYGLDSSQSYIWLADRTSPKYRTPAYALCFSKRNFQDAEQLIRLMRMNPALLKSPAQIYEPPRIPPGTALNVSPFACGSAFQYGQALKNEVDSTPRTELIGRDPSLLQRWALFRLETDFPPFLVETVHGTPTVTVKVAPSNVGCLARVEYLYRQQQGHPEKGSVVSFWLLDPTTETGIPRLVKSGPPEPEVLLPASLSGTLTVSVTPSTESRRGKTYQSASLQLHNCSVK